MSTGEAFESGAVTDTDLGSRTYTALRLASITLLSAYTDS